MRAFGRSINLKDDPEIIEKYKAYHTKPWPEIIQSFRDVGVLDIKIFLLGRQLFMYMATTNAFHPDQDFDRYLAENPKNQEWEDLMTSFQEKLPGTKPEAQWAEMELIFDMEKH